MASQNAVDILNSGNLPKPLASDPIVGLYADEAKKYQSSIDDINKRKEAELAPINQDIEAKNKELSALSAKGPEQVPIPENKAKRMDAKQLQDSMSSFMTLGALAGLLTKQPMTAALNNMTEAMKGVQEGDEERYKKAYEEFDQNYKKAINANKEKLAEYQKVFSNTKLSLDEKMREASIVAKKYGDEIAAVNLAHGNTKEFFKTIESARNAQEKAQEHRDKLAEQHEMQQLRWDQLNETKRFHDMEQAHWNEAKKAVGQKAMNPTMQKSVELDIKELNYAMDQLHSLKTQTGSAFFAGDKAHGVFGSLFGKEVTPEDQQVYDVYANRIATAIASIQSMGRGQVSDAKIREARKLVPTLGDKPAAVEAKFKAIQKISEMASETLNNATASPQGQNQSQPMTFNSEQEAEEAFKSGRIKSGDRVTIGGQTGTWN